MMRIAGNRGRQERRGSALLISIVFVTVMAGFAAAMFTSSAAFDSEVKRVANETRALYVAEAGLSAALLEVTSSLEANADVANRIGSEQAPIAYQGGSYWCTLVDNGNDSYTATATGTVGRSSRTVEAVIAGEGLDIFDHAIYAGNSSGDPDYTMQLGGSGTQADRVTGDVYSGGDLVVEGDAKITGEAAGAGVLSGVDGNEGVKRATPDIAAMDYESNHDVNVAKIFSERGEWHSDSLGGTAKEVPSSELARIFRMNPSDRSSEIGGTAKDDYFLEDPHRSVSTFTTDSGGGGHELTLAGGGNEKVYYIDGNLWIHNKRVYAMRLASEDSGSRVTFVVKGNVYFSDDVVLEDEDKDAVAFIAIKDEDYPDESGNIYLGDPVYGTLDVMQGFLYAENNFYDLNLDKSGSKQVHLFGNMTAGNHVAIQRDYVGSDGAVSHSRLTVEFDDRLSTDAVWLPGLPSTSSGVDGYRVAFWREVPNL